MLAPLRSLPLASHLFAFYAATVLLLLRRRPRSSVGLEHRASNARVAGSSPAEVIAVCFAGSYPTPTPIQSAGLCGVLCFGLLTYAVAWVRLCWWTCRSLTGQPTPDPSSKCASGGARHLRAAWRSQSAPVSLGPVTRCDSNTSQVEGFSHPSPCLPPPRLNLPNNAQPPLPSSAGVIEYACQV